jgi:hypothetical protein
VDAIALIFVSFVRVSHDVVRRGEKTARRRARAKVTHT